MWKEIQIKKNIEIKSNWMENPFHVVTSRKLVQSVALGAFSWTSVTTKSGLSSWLKYIHKDFYISKEI